MGPIWINFNLVVEMFQGLFFALILEQKDTLGTRFSQAISLLSFCSNIREKAWRRCPNIEKPSASGKVIWAKVSTLTFILFLYFKKKAKKKRGTWKKVAILEAMSRGYIWLEFFKAQLTSFLNEKKNAYLKRLKTRLPRNQASP